MRERNRNTHIQNGFIFDVMMCVGGESVRAFYFLISVVRLPQHIEAEYSRQKSKLRKNKMKKEKKTHTATTTITTTNKRTNERRNIHVTKNS